MNGQIQAKFKARAASDIGMRGSNEDAYLVDEDLGLFVVADGMGGHDKGEVASWFTSENLGKIVRSLKSTARDDTLDDVLIDLKSASQDELIQYAVLIINRRLYEENEKVAAKSAVEAGSAEAEFAALAGNRKKMGTTLVSIFMRNGRAYISHIGDSRAYHIAGETVECLTRDHSNPTKRNVLTRSVGIKEGVVADITVLNLNPPERFLLCSDGLSNMVDNAMILSFAKKPDISSACFGLVNAAKERGGRDNITAILIDVFPDSASFREDTDM